MTVVTPARVQAAQRHALRVGAVVGALCLLAAVAALAFDLRPLVFRSGSMAPSIDTGDLAVARQVPASELEVGDVVSVETASGDRVTHRVVSVTHRDGSATLALKGDANSAADAQAYDVESADRVVLSVPNGGYVLAWLSGPFGLLLLGGYVLWLLRAMGRPQPTEAGRGSITTVAAVAALGMVAMSSPTTPAPWTLAAWGDTVGVSGTTFAASTIAPSPSFTCGTLGVMSVRFDWAAVPGATNYMLHYGIGGASTLTTTSTTATITTAVSGGTAWVEVNRNFGSVTWTSAASQTRTYTVAVASLCN